MNHEFMIHKSVLKKFGSPQNFKKVRVHKPVVFLVYPHNDTSPRLGPNGPGPLELSIYANFKFITA